MWDIESWLSSDGIPAKAGAFIRPPPFPCRVYQDDAEYWGDDFHNRFCRHDITLELYNDADRDRCRDTIQKSEQKTEKLLHGEGIPFSKQSASLLHDQRMWQTIYTFSIVEGVESSDGGREKT